MQGPAVVQPAPPRRRSSSTTRPRPMSYSGDPGAQYWASGMGPPYQSPLDRGPGPPPSASAYRNMQQYQQLPHMPPYMGPQTGYYPPQYPNQTSAAFDMPRPDMPSRNSSYYGTRNQPPPLITQDLREKPVHSARYPQTKAPPQQLQLHDEPYESSGSECSSDEDYDQSRNSRALVTQSQSKPKRSKSQRRRPRLPHASTTTAVDRLAERRQSIVVPDPPKDRGRSSRTKTTTRGISASRPAAPPREIKSYESPTARVFVNSTKERRRQSTQVYDKMYEQYAQARAIEERLAKAKALEEAAHARAEEERRAKAELRAQKEQQRAQEEQQRAKEEYVAREMARLRLEQQYEAAQRAEQRIEQRAEERAEQKRQQKRASKVYYHQPVVFDDYGQEEEEEIEEPPMPLRSGRRRPTDVEGRRPRERDIETKSKTTAAEDYISAQRGSQSTYADQSYKVAKRASRIPSGPSESGSSRDEKQSLSARTVATNANNEIRLRVDASAPLSLSFNGDMEGRTLQLLPAENGMADIVIGNARGGEDTYHTSERSSIMGNNRRPLIASQARRDAEEMTERSSRSSRSRRENREREIRDDREGPRQVLRRRTDYRH
ncbi:hypothetical protein IQ07DRAFT_616009 [Pyrenochaeta sp. DS3sAY3a]|nr:hypothetical protein IQ07DRAFT_616009 [Pyrenochaeta sp. DS3sAY3a]